MMYTDATFNRALEQQWQDTHFHFYFPTIEDKKEEGRIKETLEEVVNILSILALGIGYMEYKKYKKIALSATWNEEEQQIYYSQSIYEATGEEESEELKSRYSHENAFFSLNFVLDCMLRWHL